MSIPGLGDAALLIDLATRAVCFINDLRHAQDDFLGLRSEAECLRVCINALNSEECMQTLFYISVEQGRDLKSIVDGCESNLQDLNVFVAKCAKLVANDAIPGQSKPKAPLFSKAWWKQCRPFMAKGYAAVKFVMTDKQAFRDKLVLPTASINIFLTSLTHVGLARVMKIGPVVAAPAPVPAAPPATSKLIGWNSMGRRIAFRDVDIDSVDLMIPGVEEDIIAYALQLIKGRGTAGSVKGGSGKPTKVTKPSRKPSRSRSRARFIRRNGQMYVYRDKSVSRLPIGVERVDNVERVDREYLSDSDSGRSIRLIEAPPDTYDNIRVTERRPASASDDSDKERTRRGRRSTAYNPASSAVHAELEAEIQARRQGEEVAAVREVREREEKARKEDERRRRRERCRTRRRETEERVLREKLAAVEEMERTETMKRMSQIAEGRRRTREEEAQTPQEREVMETMDYLFDEYGVMVELIPPNSRPPIDSGYVNESDAEVSDEEDARPIVPPSRVDRLRAETSRPYSSHMEADAFESGYRRSASRPYGRYASYRPYSSYRRRYEDTEPRPPIIIEDPGSSSRRRVGTLYGESEDGRYRDTSRNRENLSERIIIDNDAESNPGSIRLGPTRPPQGRSADRRASYGGYDEIHIQPDPREPRARHGSYADESYRLRRRRTDGSDDDDDNDEYGRMETVRR